MCESQLSRMDAERTFNAGVSLLQDTVGKLAVAKQQLQNASLKIEDSRKQFAERPLSHRLIAQVADFLKIQPIVPAEFSQNMCEAEEAYIRLNLLSESTVESIARVANNLS